MATWLDIDDLTRYLKLPKSTIYKLFERGELPGYRVGRGLRFDQEEVDAAIKQTLRKRPKSEGGVHDARREPKSAS